MKLIAVILAIGLMLIPFLLPEAEAKGKSFTIHVSCIVPQNLVLAIQGLNENEDLAQNIFASSRIQSQEVVYRANQKVILYTIVAR
ncbi:MAG: hypothetical protein ISS44_05405 [Candidatus Omnitrophica bacterium]|nr:hypothetical protein [Candidatus Omnitrophota bacterium]